MTPWFGWALLTLRWTLKTLPTLNWTRSLQGEPLVWFTFPHSKVNPKDTSHSKVNLFTPRWTLGLIEPSHSKVNPTDTSHSKVNPFTPRWTLPLTGIPDTLRSQRTVQETKWLLPGAPPQGRWPDQRRRNHADPMGVGCKQDMDSTLQAAAAKSILSLTQAHPASARRYALIQNKPRNFGIVHRCKGSVAQSSRVGLQAAQGNCERHHPRVAIVQAAPFWHGLSPTEFFQQAVPLAAVGMERQPSAHALPHPALHARPSILDVIRCESIRIHNLPCTVVHDLVPKVSITPPFLPLQLLNCCPCSFPAVSHKDGFAGKVEEMQALQNLLLASWAPGLRIHRALQNPEEKSIRHPGNGGSPDPDLVGLHTTGASERTWLALVQVGLVDLNHVLILFVEVHGVRGDTLFLC